MVVGEKRAGMLALYREGVTFKRKWTPPKMLPAWEGPVTDPLGLPLSPGVVIERREAKRRCASVDVPRKKLRCWWQSVGLNGRPRMMRAASTVGA